jgi:hypothetical protein
MLRLVLLIAAFICFVLAAVGVPSSRLNLVGAGLALWIFAVELLPLL